MSIDINSHNFGPTSKVRVFSGGRGMIHLQIESSTSQIKFGIDLYNNLVKQLIPELQKIVDKNEKVENGQHGKEMNGKVK